MQVELKKIKILLEIGILLVISILPINVKAQACPLNSTFDANRATLVGQIVDTGGDANISAWFEWGRSLSLGYTTPVQRLNVTYVPYRYCYTITGLSPCTTYYYRAVVQNSAGVNYGEIRSFTTPCDSYSSALRASCYAYPNPSYVGDVVKFYAEVSGGTAPYSYYWSGDCSGSASICQKAFNAPGTYYAYLTVYSGNQSVSTSCSVNVLARLTQPVQQATIQSQNQKPIAEIKYTPTSITPGTKVTFSALNSYDPDGKIILYEWKINDKLVSNNPTFSRALSTGTYKITLTVVDDKGATSSKELVISVGRTQFVPQTVVKTVTKTVKVPVKVSNQTQQAQASPSKNQFNLLDISLDEDIKASLCKKDSLNITIINNSNQTKNITFNVNGEIKKWFKPKARIIQVSPNDLTSFNWSFEIPCDIEEGEYYGVITANINGAKKDFPVNISIVKSKGVFEPLTAFVGGVFEAKYLPWLLVIILILMNFVMWYYLIFKSKSKIE